MMSESFSRSSPALKEHREELAAERSNTSATSGEANPIIQQGCWDSLDELAVVLLGQRDCKVLSPCRHALNLGDGSMF